MLSGEISNCRLKITSQISGPVNKNTNKKDMCQAWIKGSSVCVCVCVCVCVNVSFYGFLKVM